MWTPGIPLMAKLVPVNRWGKWCEDIKDRFLPNLMTAICQFKTPSLLYSDGFCL